MTVFANPELANLQRAHESLEQAHADLSEKVRRMDAVLCQVLNRLNDVEGITLFHQDRVAELAELITPKVKPKDQTNEQILAYLRDAVPGRWQTPGSVAVNLDLDGKSVADRLYRLARGDRDNGLEMLGGRGTGQNLMYRVVPPPAPEA